MKLPKTATLAALFSTLFTISTASAAVFDSSKVHDLKASQSAGNIFGPSAFGKADVFEVTKPLMFAKNSSKPTSLLKLSEDCSVSTESNKRVSRLVKEGSSYGLNSVFTLDIYVRTLLGTKKVPQTTFMLSNALYLPTNTPDLIFITCTNINADSTIGELKSALGNSFNLN